MCHICKPVLTTNGCFPALENLCNPPSLLCQGLRESYPAHGRLGASVPVQDSEASFYTSLPSGTWPSKRSPTQHLLNLPDSGHLHTAVWNVPSSKRLERLGLPSCISPSQVNSLCRYPRSESSLGSSVQCYSCLQ